MLLSNCLSYLECSFFSCVSQLYWPFPPQEAGLSSLEGVYILNIHKCFLSPFFCLWAQYGLLNLSRRHMHKQIMSGLWICKWSLSICFIFLRYNVCYFLSGISQHNNRPSFIIMTPSHGSFESATVLGLVYVSWTMYLLIFVLFLFVLPKYWPPTPAHK